MSNLPWNPKPDWWAERVDVIANDMMNYFCISSPLTHVWITDEIGKTLRRIGYQLGKEEEEHECGE